MQVTGMFYGSKMLQFVGFPTAEILGPDAIGRGGPNLVRGMGAMRDTFDALGLPYRIFGFDSDMSEVINYAKAVDAWMKSGGRERVAQKLGVSASASPQAEAPQP